MKKLFEFESEEEVTTYQPSKEVDPQSDSGEMIEVKRPFKSLTKRKFFIRKPGRALYDEADLFYSKQFSFLVQKGILTTTQLAKRFDDDDGIFSKKEITIYEKLRNEMLDALGRKNKLEETLQDERSKEYQTKINDVNLEIQVVEEQIRKYQVAQNMVFENTAEYKAKDKTSLFWTLYLSYEEKDGKYIPIFKDAGSKEDEFEDRIKIFDEIQESDDTFMERMRLEFLYLITVWNSSGIDNDEDFKKALEIRDEDLRSSRERTEETSS
tara:strand:+ start:126112 stop:126915 length:804 start_codon:yes stop_codon:yes gene_type:complete